MTEQFKMEYGLFDFNDETDRVCGCDFSRSGSLVTTLVPVVVSGAFWTPLLVPNGYRASSARPLFKPRPQMTTDGYFEVVFPTGVLSSVRHNLVERSAQIFAESLPRKRSGGTV